METMMTLIIFAFTLFAITGAVALSVWLFRLYINKFSQPQTVKRGETKTALDLMLAR